MRRCASKHQRLLLWAAQDGLCAICGRDLPDRFEVDHLIPYSQQGATETWNLQAMCIQCHDEKHSAKGRSAS